MISSFFNFVFESSVCLAVFAIIDLLFYSKSNQFKGRRFFLLFALLFSILLPFLNFDLNFAQEATPITIAATNANIDVHLLEAVTIYASGVTEKVGQSIIQLQPIVLAYLIGSLFALIFIIAGILQIGYKIRKYRRFQLNGIKLVVAKEASSYSFFNIIFINHTLPREKHWKSIIMHELVHVKQMHSFDILVLDVLMMIFWFNPFYWVIRKNIKDNHEFLADAEVLNKGLISKGKYKALLLNQLVGGKVLFTSNFKMKSTQKRFKMMSNLSNRKFSFLKSSVAFLVAIVVSLSFSVDSKVNAQTPVKTYNSSDVFVYKNKVVSKEDLDITLLGQPVIEVVSYSKFSSEFEGLKNQIAGDKVVLVFDLSNSLEADRYSKFKGTEKSVPITTRENPKETTFRIVENMPKFPGGEKELSKFIGENTQYPKSAAESGVQGKVYVEFVVDQEGNVVEAEVVRGVDPRLDKEALRVINLLPKFKPGTQKGEPVRVAFTLTVNFSLN